MQEVRQPSPFPEMSRPLSFSIPIVLPLGSELGGPSPEVMDTTPQQGASQSASRDDVSSSEGLGRSVNEVHINQSLTTAWVLLHLQILYDMLSWEAYESVSYHQKAKAGFCHCSLFHTCSAVLKCSGDGLGGRHMLIHTLADSDSDFLSHISLVRYPAWERSSKSALRVSELS